MRRFLGAATALVLAASLAPPASVDAAASTLWPNFVRRLGHVEVMKLGPDGVHHIVMDDPTNEIVSYYATDRGGTWTIQKLLGYPADGAVDAAGKFSLLVYDNRFGQDSAVRLFTEQGGELVGETVTTPGGAGDGFRANLGGIDVASDGTISVTWSARNENFAFYRAKSAAGWSETVTLGSAELIPGLHGLDVVVDGADVPHVIASGARFLGNRPEACPNPDLGSCTVDVTMSADPTTVGIGTAYGDVDAILGHDGDLEMVLKNDYQISYATNAGGTWLSEPIISVNSSGATIGTSAHGTAVFYASGSPYGGVKRASRGPSGWSISSVTTGVDSWARGTVDAAGRSHVAFSKISWHEPEGWVGDAWLVAPDEVAPVIGTPIATPRTGKTTSSTTPTRISWSATDALSGLARYQLQQSTNGGAWTTISATLTSKYADRSLKPGATTYRFRVRGWDKAGNVSAYVDGPTITVRRYQQSKSLIRYGGSWKTHSSSAYWGGSAKYATSKTASATITFTGRAFAWLSRYGSARGSARVIVDGDERPSVSLRRSDATYRVIAYSISWPESGPHTVVIKPAGTAGRPRIDLDGVILIR